MLSWGIPNAKKQTILWGGAGGCEILDVSRSEQMMSKVLSSKSWSRIVCPFRFKHLATMYGEEAITIRKPPEKGYFLTKSSDSKQLGIKIQHGPSTSPLDEIALFAAGTSMRPLPVFGLTLLRYRPLKFLFGHGVIFSLLLRDAPCHQVSECVATNKTRRCARINQ